MNRKDLYNSFNEVDDDILKRSESTAKRKKQPVWLKWGATAACLCLVVGLVIPMLNNGTSEPHQEELPPAAKELPPVIDKGPTGMDTPEVVMIEFNGV